MTDERYNVYMFYVIIMLGIKHNFEIVDTLKPEALTGRGEPDKKIGNQYLYYLWKDTKIQGIEEFNYDYWKLRIN